MSMLVEIIIYAILVGVFGLIVNRISARRGIVLDNHKNDVLKTSSDTQRNPVFAGWGQYSYRYRQ